jgi:hypothetical protein
VPVPVVVAVRPARPVVAAVRDARAGRVAGRHAAPAAARAVVPVAVVVADAAASAAVAAAARAVTLVAVRAAVGVRPAADPDQVSRTPIFTPATVMMSLSARRWAAAPIGVPFTKG